MRHIHNLDHCDEHERFAADISMTDENCMTVDMLVYNRSTDRSEHFVFRVLITVGQGILPIFTKMIEEETVLGEVMGRSKPGIC